MAIQKQSYWLIMALVIIVFHINYGLDILVPTNITWLMDARHDWGTHYLGWAFYRDAPWTFPLGDMNNYCYPSGTNVGLTDSIVLPALLLKPFSGILPDDFQYLGLFLLFCHLMTAHYAVKIFRLYNVRGLFVVLGAVFISCNPVLFYRGMHPSLCTHGFILASLYYYLKPVTAATSVSVNKAQVTLTLIMSLISPYMWLMIIGFNVILPLKHIIYDKQLTWKKAWVFPSVAFVGSLLLWYIVGILNFDNTSLEVDSSYGLYAFNLNSFHNSGGFASLMPQRPWVSWHQYEGYMYLGVGMMLLIAIAALYLLVTRKLFTIAAKNKYLLPLSILAVLLALFAITNKVTYDDRLLFEYPLPNIVTRVGNIFRASGRFMWVPYYLLLVFTLLVVFRNKFPDWVKLSVISVIIFIQAYDLKPLYTFRNYKYGSYDSPLDEEKWNAIIPHFDRMITYPPFQNHLLNQVDYQDLAYLAVKNNKPVTVGYSAREDLIAYKTYTDSLNLAIENDELRDDELYITTPKDLDAFSGFIHNKTFEIEYLDGYYVLFHKKKGIPDFMHDAIAKKKLDSVNSLYSETKFLKIIDNPEFIKEKVRFNIENLSINDKNVRVRGWAFLEGRTDNKGDSVFVTLTGPDKTYIAKTAQFGRPDLTTAYKAKNLESSGFSASIFTDGLDPYNYTLGLAILSGNTWTYAKLGTLKELKTTEKPVKVASVPAQVNQAGNIDEFSTEGREIMVSGWSAFTDADAIDNEILVLFVKEGQTYAVPTKSVMRPDVTASYKNKYRYDTSGFSVRVEKKMLPKGVYKTGILVRNIKTGRESAMVTGKEVEIK